MCCPKCLLLFALFSTTLQTSQLGIYFSDLQLILNLPYTGCRGFLFYGTVTNARGNCKSFLNGGVSYLRCNQNLPSRQMFNVNLNLATLKSGQQSFYLTGTLKLTTDSTGIGNGMLNGTLCA